MSFMRVFLATASFALITLPSVGETPASTGDVYACSAIQTDAERLNCYDLAVGRLKAAEDAGEVATVTREEVEQVKRDSFGFSIPSLPKLALPKLGGGDDGQLDEITQNVVTTSTNSLKKVVVTLENGQVWQQIDSATIFISKKSPPKTATIKSAALGSYKMKLAGKSFRVKRIK